MKQEVCKHPVLLLPLEDFQEILGAPAASGAGGKKTTQKRRQKRKRIQKRPSGIQMASPTPRPPPTPTAQQSSCSREVSALPDGNNTWTMPVVPLTGQIKTFNNIA
ncbi:hypothetical protein B0H19DRAFT_1256243 [Mycena capillaripes]|nr:hypothetical protein B0H19DRAFT_1256243 [Mycena capillaripes]